MEESLKKLEDTSESSSDIANTWNTAHETLLASIGDKANCMRWMHTQSQVYYERWNFWMAVPSVTVSALAGSATIGMTRLDTSAQAIASIIIGVFTIASGVLTSINQLLKASQFAEAHRIASVAYGKLHRVIANELALRRDQRTNAQEFLKVIRTEQDRLEESSPVVGDNIIDKFNNKVESNTTLEKPEIVGALDHVNVNTSMKPPSNTHQLFPHRQRSEPTPSSPKYNTKPLPKSPVQDSISITVIPELPELPH